MANPINLFVVPKCSLEIRIEEWDKEKESDPTDSSHLRMYEIKNFGLDDDLDIPPEHEKQCKYGLMSPVCNVSLPPYSMEIAGIPKKSEYVAFIYPPSQLCSQCFEEFEFNEEQVNDDGKSLSSKQLDQWPRGQKDVKVCTTADQITTQENLRRRIAQFSVCGAFVYFNSAMDILSINTVSFFRTTRYKLALSGPFEASLVDRNKMIEFKQVQQTKTELLHENGFVAFAWQRPGEDFQEKRRRNRSLDFNQDIDHGRFIFYRDNGTAITYNVIRDNCRENLQDFPRGNFDSSLADAFECIIKDTPSRGNSLSSDSTNEFLFVKKGMRHDDFQTSRQAVLRALSIISVDDQETDDHDQQIAEDQEAVDDIKKTFYYLHGAPVLHLAIKCKFELTDIKIIAAKYGEIDHVDTMYEWTAIHYACRFCADRPEIVSYLLEECKDEIIIKTDKFMRNPLHIACDSNACEKVIDLLVGYNDYIMVSAATKHMKSLPLHFACNKGADFLVIKKLLDAGKKRHTCALRERTKVGRLPLHFAIQKKLKPRVIELLLEYEKESEINEKHSDHLVKKLIISGEIISRKNSIYQDFHGLLPIHLASLHELDAESIRILVERDIRGDAAREAKRLQEQIKSPEEERFFTENRASYYFSTDKSMDNNIFCTVEDNPCAEEDRLPRHLAFTRGLRALQLCLLSKSEENIVLILRKEDQINIELAHRQGLAEEINDDKRTCLHLACKYNCSEEIINLLIALDPKRLSTRMKDRNGNVPLHLACHQKRPNIAVIQKLLDVDIKKNTSVGVSKKGIANSLDMQDLDLLDDNVRTICALDNFGRNPFSLAIKSEAPADVLALLMTPPHFDIAGLHEREIIDLARRVKKSQQLRSCLNYLFAQRLPFALFSFFLIIHCATIILFVRGCNKFLKNEYYGIDELEIILFIICILLLLVRELIQFKSEGWDYIFDVQSHYELTGIGLLLKSVIIFTRKENIDEETILIFTTLILIVTTIAVLRNTILRFSEFAGGLIVIFRTLVPFLSVSVVLLFLFSHSLRLKLSKENSLDEDDKALKGLCHPTKRSGTDCFLATLNVFFGGSADVETRTYLDILFGIIVLLVLLNVNIAIVNDAWVKAKDHATDMFWRGRLSYLREISDVVSWRSKESKSSLFRSIDEYKFISFRGPKCSWSHDFPYNKVWKSDEYFKPDDYFPPETALLIKNARSIKSDLYWLRQSNKQQPGRRPNEDLERLAKTRRNIYWDWCFQVCIYCILFLLGLFLGIFWPEDLRLWLVSLGTSVEDGSSNRKDDLEEASDFGTSNEDDNNNKEKILARESTKGWT